MLTGSPLTGLEIVMLGLIPLFITQTRSSDMGDFVAYVAQRHDGIPFEGSEREVFDTLIDAIVESGVTRDQIGAFLECSATLLTLVSIEHGVADAR